MAVEFLKYKYQDGIVYDEKRCNVKRYGIGLRHVQMVYMFACIAVLYMVRGGAGIAVMEMTNEAQRNDTSTLIIFTWNKKTQATIFSAFFFGYSTLMIPAEMCSKQFNGKYVLLFVLLVNGFLCLALPTVSEKGDWIAVSNSHLLMGMTQSCTLPAIQLLLTKWLPPHERNFIGAFVYSGVNVGTILSMPLASLCADTVVKWCMVYYGGALVSLSMAVCWCILTAAAPAKHEAVGDKEREYIEKACSTHKTLIVVPWKQILRTKPIWALIFAHTGYQIVYILFIYGMPIYFRNVLQIESKNVGWISALPFLIMWMISLALFPSSGHVYKNTVLSYIFDVTYFRKLLNTTGAFGVIIGLTILSALSEGHRNLAVTMAIVTYSSTAFQFTGFMENHGDIAPQYAGTVLFITSFVANSVGSFVPILIGVILDLKLSPEAQWRIIFLSVATLAVICNFVYIKLGNSETLEWNGYQLRPNNKNEENKLMFEDIKQTRKAYKDESSEQMI